MWVNFEYQWVHRPKRLFSCSKKRENQPYLKYALFQPAQFGPIYHLSAIFLIRYFYCVCLVVYKKLQKEVQSALFTGISRLHISDDIWAITDRKMSQSGSKINKWELTSNFNGLPGQKFGIPAHETGKNPEIGQIIGKYRHALGPPWDLMRSKYIGILKSWTSWSY